MEKIRNIKFDTFKGILIYLVVLGHLTFSYKYYNSDIFLGITRFIYSFHMPLFLIISGYYSKKNNKNNLIKLFILFILVNLSYIFYDYFTVGDFNIFNIKYSAWYLLSIFIYRIILLIPNISIKFQKHKKIILSLLFVLSIVIGLFEINFIFSRILGFSFFFFFGLSINDVFLKQRLSVTRSTNDIHNVIINKNICPIYVMSSSASFTKWNINWSVFRPA